MRVIQNILTALVVLLGVAALSPAVRAETRSAGTASAPHPIDIGAETTEKQFDSPLPMADKDDDFVDKDGDGIRDGQERRFRRGSKNREKNGRHSGKGHRNRAKKGRGGG